MLLNISTKYNNNNDLIVDILTKWTREFRAPFLSIETFRQGRRVKLFYIGGKLLSFNL